MKQDHYSKDDEASIIQMRRDGISFAEIAQALGRTENAIKTQHAKLTNIKVKLNPDESDNLFDELMCGEIFDEVMRGEIFMDLKL